MPGAFLFMWEYDFLSKITCALSLTLLSKCFLDPVVIFVFVYVCLFVWRVCEFSPSLSVGV